MHAVFKGLRQCSKNTGYRLLRFYGRGSRGSSEEYSKSSVNAQLADQLQAGQAGACLPGPGLHAGISKHRSHRPALESSQRATRPKLQAHARCFQTAPGLQVHRFAHLPGALGQSRRRLRSATLALDSPSVPGTSGRAARHAGMPSTRGSPKCPCLRLLP